jgi:Holliday junction resolvase RusA-like endonuclease
MGVGENYFTTFVFMQKIKIKPLSVNTAFKGRRFRTKEYDQYQKELLWLLKPLTIPEGKLCLTITYGLSSPLSDLDNPNKQFIDTLSKKYGFNDNRIYRLNTEKVDVNKGCEFIEFEITEYNY